MCDGAAVFIDKPPSLKWTGTHVEVVIEATHGRKFVFAFTPSAIVAGHMQGRSIVEAIGHQRAEPVALRDG